MRYIYLNGKDENKPELVLIRGIQGSGKSTLAKKIAEDNNYIHKENDQYFTNENGEYNFDFSKHQLAKETTLNDVKKILSSGKNVVVSNTFNKLNELTPYLNVAKEVGATINIIGMQLDMGSIHNIPRNIIDKAKSEYEYLEIEQSVNSKNYILVKGNEEYLDLMNQNNLNTGHKMPVRMIKEIGELLSLAKNEVNYKRNNSKIGTQKEEILTKSLMLVSKFKSNFENNKLDKLIDNIKDFGNYDKNAYLPKIFVEKLTENEEFKNQVQVVINSYLNRDNEAEKKDKELTEKLYNSLGFDTAKERNLSPKKLKM